MRGVGHFPELWSDLELDDRRHQQADEDAATMKMSVGAGTSD
jgi:hypothetical protein